MKQKEEIAAQQETINLQKDKVNANRLEITRQSNQIQSNNHKIQVQEVKLEQQKEEFNETFLANSDRIFRQGDLIEEQKQQLQQLTLRIEDVETLLDEVSEIAYDKGVEVVSNIVKVETHKEDIRLVEQSKAWVLSPERKASKKECEYAAKRLDGVITKITNAMKTTLQKIQANLMKPEIRKNGTEQIKQKARTSILEKLNQNKEKIKRQNNIPNQKIEIRKDKPEL